MGLGFTTLPCTNICQGIQARFRWSQSLTKSQRNKTLSFCQHLTHLTCGTLPGDGRYPWWCRGWRGTNVAPGCNGFFVEDAHGGIEEQRSIWWQGENKAWKMWKSQHLGHGWFEKSIGNLHISMVSVHLLHLAPASSHPNGWTTHCLTCHQRRDWRHKETHVK